MAESQYQDAVIGLDPNSTLHDTDIDIEPVSLNFLFFYHITF